VKNENETENRENDPTILLRRRVRGIRIDLFMTGKTEVSKDGITVKDTNGIVEEDIIDEQDPNPIELDFTDNTGQIVFQKKYSRIS